MINDATRKRALAQVVVVVVVIVVGGKLTRSPANPLSGMHIKEAVAFGANCSLCNASIKCPAGSNAMQCVLGAVMMPANASNK